MTFWKVNSPNQKWTNLDFWEIIAVLIKDRRELITIQKVKAHVDWQQQQGDMRIQAWHNDQVDKAAKRAVHDSPQYSKYLNIVKVLQQQELATSKYCDFLFATALDVFETKRVRGEYREKFDVELLSVTGVGVKLSTNLSALKEVPDKEQRFPAVFLEGIVQWCNRMTWES